MTATDNSVERRNDGCELCGDVAIAGRVIAVDANTRTATVAYECRTETVALDLVEAGVGDVLLVHVGFAISRLDGA